MINTEYSYSKKDSFGNEIICKVSTAKPTPTAAPTPTATPIIAPTTIPTLNDKTANIIIQYCDEENNKIKDDVILTANYKDGDTYTIPEILKQNFTVKTEDGLYNLYNVNDMTSQLTVPYTNEMTLMLKFNNVAQYDYYEDFENYTVDASKWKKQDSSVPLPMLENDNTKYIQHKTGSSTTGAYTTFDEIGAMEKTVKITADLKFTEPAGNNKGNSQFTIGNTNPSFSGNNITWGAVAGNTPTDGHIIGLEYNGGSTLRVNGEMSDTDFIGDWVHLDADADFSSKTVKITLSNKNGKSAEYETSFFSSNLESNIGSMYLRSAGESGSVSVDNLTVKIIGDAGPVVPNIESPINHKSVYAFGDSIVYGHTAPKQSFMRLISNDYSIKLNMMAKNGATIMPSNNQILNQINNAPDIAPDIVLFEGYTNDAYGSEETDSFNSGGANRDVTQCYGEITADGITEFDANTFCGAFEQTIYTMKQKWQTSKFVFVTIHKSGARNREIQKKLHDLSVAICKKWNVEVVDMFADSALDTTDTAQMLKYMIGGKGSHPNVSACKEFYIPAVVEKLERLCGSGNVSPSPSPSIPTEIPIATPTITPAAIPTRKPDEKQCVKIIAEYDDNGVLKDIKTETISISEAVKPDNSGHIKIFYWESLESMKPIEFLSDNVPDMVFVFGSDSVSDGEIAVGADMAYGKQYDGRAYGFYGLENSPDVSDGRTDGFKYSDGEPHTVLKSGNADGKSYVEADYSTYDEDAVKNMADGKMPVRFSVEAEEHKYYTVSATVVNTSATENANVTLYSEKRHAILFGYNLKPNESITKTWNVNLESVVYLSEDAPRSDTQLNFAVVGDNAGLSRIEIKKNDTFGTTVWIAS